MTSSRACGATSTTTRSSSLPPPSPGRTPPASSTAPCACPPRTSGKAPNAADPDPKSRVGSGRGRDARLPSTVTGKFEVTTCQPTPFRRRRTSLWPFTGPRDEDGGPSPGGPFRGRDILDVDASAPRLHGPLPSQLREGPGDALAAGADHGGQLSVGVMPGYPGFLGGHDTFALGEL